MVPEIITSLEKKKKKKTRASYTDRFPCKIAVFIGIKRFLIRDEESASSQCVSN